MERRGRALVLVALLTVSATAAALAGPAGAGGTHGNHVTATSQVVGDGQVYVESLFIISEGWLVIRADDGGRPGEVLGVREVSLGYHGSVPVDIDRGSLPADGSTKVWAVLHRDDGDGEFELSDDEALQSFGSLAGVTFSARAGEGSARVVVPSTRGKKTDGRVIVDRVDLPASGYLVVHSMDGGDPGRVVGHEPLPAGTHRNVTVGLNRSWYEEMPKRFAMLASVYRDDGDGEFDPDADTPITVGGDRVMTRLGVSKVPNGSLSATTTTTALINTPSATTSDTATTRATTTAPATTGPTGSGGGSASTPGFGPSLAVVGLLIGVLAALAARRRR